ncbi:MULTISPECIES: hypothetical protein [unclassified Microbacterium]|uniref:hypothetical protein n=1 Tax=unclassified Microbacterium TaxID=2609290 RepID=UPI000EAA0F6B|nr:MULTISPECIES: hypothetical protein [unclassified Microbacterium]MBT2486203.1 hypothetical protein [Microbacterium sp. ISL-108]RKN68925.1 hypothetical protein D7252_15975 [Microbacterium sp. CGR2]
MKRGAKITMCVAAAAVAGVGTFVAGQLLAAPADPTPAAAAADSAPTHTPKPEFVPPNAANGGLPDNCTTWSAIRFGYYGDEDDVTTSVHLDGPGLVDTGATVTAAGQVSLTDDGRPETYRSSPAMRRPESATDSASTT